MKAAIAVASRADRLTTSSDQHEGLESKWPTAGSYLYRVLAVYSREIVGFAAHEGDDSDHAARLVQRPGLAEGIHALPREWLPVLHGDNGATLKAATLLAMLWWLCMKPS